MSWDVVLFNFQGDPPHTDDLGDAFENPPAMGDAAEIREKVSESLPEVDWSDPTWGILQGEGWSIEFNHQETGETVTMMLHVRGSGDPITSIANLCKANNWSAFDTSSGEFLNLDAPSNEGWTEFQEYRDLAISSTQTFPSSDRLLTLVYGTVVVAIIVMIVLVMLSKL